MAEAPHARVVRNRAALADAIAQWPGSNLTTTWALVAVREVPTTHDLAALKHAAKLCDRVASVVIPATVGEAAKTLPAMPGVVRAAGADVVWVPAAEANSLLKLVATDGSSAKLLMQALLAVLPSVVVVAQADLPLVRQWRLLQTEFGVAPDLMII